VSLPNRNRETGRCGSTALRSRSYSRLGHPAWWGALLVLWLNDHWLKSADLAPGWFTGKLSDFAGLLVAPVLLVALSGAERRHTRALCFGAVAGGFAAINLWPSAARAAEQLASVIGLSWRLWCDPTDLLALTVLPMSWHLARPAVPTARASTSRGLLHRLAAVLGAIGCLATGEYEVWYVTSAYVVNKTRAPLDVRIYRAAQPLDCSLLAGDAAGSLGPESFELESCEQLEPLSVTPLDRGWQKHDDTGLIEQDDYSGPPLPCEAVLVHSEATGLVLLFWDHQAKIEVDAHYEPPPERHGVFIERAGDRVYLVGSELIEARAVSWAQPPGNCGDVLDGGEAP
jgi:hypothetical protein